MLALLLVVIFIAVITVVGYSTIKGYWESDANQAWHRLLDSARGSATILWLKVSGFAVSVIGELLSLADLFDFPGVKDWIQAAVDPRIWPLIALAMILVGFFARRRTL